MILLMLAFFIIAATGCPAPESADDDNETANGVEVDQDTDATNGLGASDDAGQGSGSEPEVIEGDNEEFVPTVEEPLAPPADQAVGVEDVEPGQLALICSLDGIGDPVTLEDGISVGAIDSLLLQVSIVNTMDDVQTIMFATSQKLDLFISDQDDNAIFKWSEGVRFANVLNSIELNPGDVWAHELTIPIGLESGKVPPGTYNMAVLVTGEPALALNVSDIEITR